MNLFDILALLLTLTALFAYLNHRYIRLPTTIGVMLIALLGSLSLMLLERLGLELRPQAAALLGSIDFDQTLLHGMLSFLLFAGALHVDINDLAQQKWAITSLATCGLLVSALIVGSLSWTLLHLIGVELSWIYCLLFGALISPTDPIAVLGLLRTAGAPKSLETKIVGESLFNDGVGVVVFLVLLELATAGGQATAAGILLLFLREAVGGALLGLALGWLAYTMLKSVDNYQVEILITLALVAGGYSLAGSLHMSGPIAVVVAGLLIGNHGRAFAMSVSTREHLDTFWVLMDEVLNAMLFVLIGLEVLVLDIRAVDLVASTGVIAVVLLARLVSVAGVVTLLRRVREFSPRAVLIMTWGGLRGGISVALALSLPASPERQVIVALTYAVVVFSIVVQGLTIQRVAAKSVIDERRTHS